MSSGRSPRPRSSARAWGAVLPVLLLGAVVVAALSLFTDLIAGERDMIARIAEDPWAFEGRDVTLDGVVAETPARFGSGRRAFVLAGEAGDRLLVLPAGPADLPPLGRAVEVSGTVRPPARAADERRPELPPVTLTDLLDRTSARAIVEDAKVGPRSG